MSGVNRIVKASLAKSKKKGKAFVAEVQKAFSPKAIAKVTVSKKKK